MDKKPTRKNASELRRKAEERLAQRPVSRQTSEADTQRLLHELQVHQIELEMQNEELQLAIQRAMNEASAREQADQELRIAAIAFETQNAMVVTDPNGVILRVNPGFTRITGYSAAEAIGQTMALLKSGRQDAFFYHRFWDSLKEKGAWQGEIWNKRKNGLIYAEMLFIKAVGTPAHGTTHYVASFSDITARKQAEEVLKDRESYFRGLYENAPLPYQSLDIDGNILEVNEAWLTMLGYTHEEVMGRFIGDFLTKVSLGTLSCEFPRFKAQGTVDGPEFDLICKDGTCRRVVINGRVAHDSTGTFQRTQCILTDITEKNRIDEELDRHRYHLEELLAERTAELQSAETKYRTVADFTYSWETWIDDAGHWLYCSPSCERITGYRAEEFLSRPELFVEITHADDRASLVAHLGGLVHKGVCDFEFRIHHKNGELRWIEHLCQPVRDAVGKSLGRRASNSDITARKRAKQLLADNAKQLHELSSHLQSVREEERTRVARELHDELGQLLTALKMDVSLLLADTPVSSGAAARLASMTRLADEALGTIHRIAADLRPVMLDDLGLRAAIEWLVEEFGKRYPAITCNLVFDHVGDTIEGEMATAAYRIVQECLTNIIRHAEASKVHIVVAVRERREILIAVQDNGRGLREPITKEGGFGLLGMRERAMALGGSFSVGSIPGEGVSVDVTIPLPDIEYGSAP